MQQALNVSNPHPQRFIVALQPLMLGVTHADRFLIFGWQSACETQGMSRCGSHRKSLKGQLSRQPFTFWLYQQKVCPVSASWPGAFATSSVDAIVSGNSQAGARGVVPLMVRLPR